MSQDRKKDHIELAGASQTKTSSNHGLVYEPMLSGFKDAQDLSIEWAGKKLKYPLWISSMTGGTEKAGPINANLARAAGKSGIGMGLGSCRSLIDSDQRLEDFKARKYIGDGVLFANLGIAQTERLLASGKTDKITEMVKKLEADGLIIHVNPLQEYMQPEGDIIQAPPLQTIKRLIERFKLPLIVKEVGQGMGPCSLRELCKLPLEAIEFSAFGGTNFTKLEQTRHKAFNSGKKNELLGFADIGHSASEMVEWLNQILEENDDLPCRKFIISGGVNSMITGHSLRSRLNAPSLIGMAKAYLDKALISSEAVEELIEEQAEALNLASLYLK
ncbi:MAG: hypothetical protein WD025_08860 [Bacteriovoracaceae bacterium]